MRSRSRQLIHLVVMAAVSIGLLAGMNAVGSIRERNREYGRLLEDFQDLVPADTYKSLLVDGTFTKARSILDIHQALSSDGGGLGYVLLVEVPGYASDLTVRVAVDKTGHQVLGARVASHGEPESTGGRVTLPVFHTQFEGRTAPLYLRGEQPPADPEPRTLRDGTYSAEDAAADPATGYRHTFTMKVSGGRIADALWDAVRDDGGKSLRKASQDGEYILDGALPWHEQAIAMEALLIRLGDPAFILVNADGTTGAAEGVTIPVAPFVTLAETCTAQAAIPSLLTGTLNDGLFRAQQEQFDPATGYRDFVELTIEKEKIVSIVWNAEREDGSLRSDAEDGGGVPEGSAPWGEQAAAMAAWLMKLQDPTVVSVDSEGRAPEVPGVVVPVSAALDLMRGCMLQAGMSAVAAATPTPALASGLIDAVSGATVTSRAVVKAANLAVEYVVWILSAKADAGS